MCQITLRFTHDAYVSDVYTISYSNDKHMLSEAESEFSDAKQKSLENLVDFMETNKVVLEKWDGTALIHMFPVSIIKRESYTI